MLKIQEQQIAHSFFEITAPFLIFIMMTVRNERTMKDKKEFIANTF